MNHWIEADDCVVVAEAGTRRRYMERQGWSLEGAAPLSHTMWRGYLAGQVSVEERTT
jgi:hypothetical protein